MLKQTSELKKKKSVSIVPELTIGDDSGSLYLTGVWKPREISVGAKVL